MRILLLNDDFPPLGKGGAATVTRNLASGYAAKGHDVHVLTTHQSGESARTSTEDGYRTTSLPLSYRLGVRPYLSLWNPQASPLIRAFLEGHGEVDMVHAHNVHAYLTYAGLRMAASRARMSVITFHDVISFSYGRLATPRYLAGTPGRFDHRLTIADQIAQAGLLWNPLRNACIRRALRCVTHRIAVSNALRDALTQNRVPCNGVIHNGIDPSHVPSAAAVEACRTRWNSGSGPTVFFGGRLSGDKGIRELLAAMQRVWRQMPHAQLLVVGDRTKADAWVRDHAPEAADRIVTTGWLEHEDVLCALAMSDVCVTPSMCFDSFPTVNLEAMAMGKPVIATWYGGSSELVEHGVTGLIINPADAESLGDAIAGMLHDDARRKAMGAAGLHRVRETFTLNGQIDAYLALLRS